VGDPGIQAETLRDYEVGYRISLNSRVLLDFAGFYSFYRDLESVELRAPQVSVTPDQILISSTVQFGNSLRAQNYGAEASVTWNAASRWKLAGSYSWLKANLYGPSVESNIRELSEQNPLIGKLASTGPVQQILNSSQALTSNLTEGTLPRHQFNVQSYLDLTTKLSFDNSLYFVDTLPSRGVPAYARLDSSIGWKLSKKITAHLVGQNLLSPHHLEFGNVEQAIATETTRSISGKIVWSF
jgi:iron complex outermembrane receptor protein